MSRTVWPIQEGQRAEGLPERPGTQQDDATAVSSCRKRGHCFQGRSNAVSAIAMVYRMISLFPLLISPDIH